VAFHGAEHGTMTRQVNVTIFVPTRRSGRTADDHYSAHRRLGLVDVRAAFPNFNIGSPSWGTFEDTFGAFEVWHELLDPVFGHPLLTTAFYIFYEHFLKGEGAGGLATGFCTSLSAKVLDEFWTGSPDTFTRISLTDDVRDELPIRDAAQPRVAIDF
jgi:hypothetical protein